MKKKYKYTFYENGCKVVSCVVNEAQKAAFERLIGTMAAYCSFHKHNIQFECTEIVTVKNIKLCKQFIKTRLVRAR